MSTEPTAVPTLLVVMSVLVVTATIAIATLLWTPSWIMLVVAMTAFLGGAAFLVAYLSHLIDASDEEVVAVDEAVKQPAPVAAPLAHA